MSIPKGSEIQGVLLLSDECYRNDKLIIPEGKYLGIKYLR